MDFSSSKFKKILIFQEIEIANPKIKKVRTVSKKKSFLIFRKIKLLKKASYISEGNFPSSKNKKNPLKKSLLYFGKWNFLAPKKT